ncbi:hypothetical protein NHX12_031366 [Muraenolepis orangiensis]|uniref:Uncharacterized protein n=1 Tax=Muraenolepis orangiensis TaxID=630683 RepID=A0A9Q0E556_9TELE|nr:hypothetical protein NHX12_031366 [Muraenolepis orangiensis]
MNERLYRLNNVHVPYSGPAHGPTGPFNGALVVHPIVKPTYGYGEQCTVFIIIERAAAEEEDPKQMFVLAGVERRGGMQCQPLSPSQAGHQRQLAKHSFGPMEPGTERVHLNPLVSFDSMNWFTPSSPHTPSSTGMGSCKLRQSASIHTGHEVYVG